MSQIIASWIGQGSYYVAMVAGGLFLYRGLIQPEQSVQTRKRRLPVVSAVGLGFLVLTAGMSAASVIPRLEYNSLTNVAGGVYRNEHVASAINGGWKAGQTRFSEVMSDPYYTGSVVIALAVVSAVLSRGRHATPYFSFVVLIGFILSAKIQTPLHSLFYAVFPRFEDLHRHWPERVAMVAFIAIAILAGAAIDSLASWAGSRKRLISLAMAPLAILVAFVIGLDRAGDSLPVEVVAGVLVVVAALLLVGLARSPAAVSFVPIALVLLLTADLVTANGHMIANGPYGGYHRVDIQSYLGPSNAAQFLIGRSRDETFRYFGFDHRLEQLADGWPVYYRYQFANERTRSLIVNNRASLHGLQDIQGYNPVQMQAYVRYMSALNGKPQDYHDANVLPGGLESPLLDLLNARYLIVPSAITAEADPLLERLRAAYETVFDDGLTRVLERRSALPRAWVVHDAMVATPEEAWSLLSAGEIDPRTTATIEGTIPDLRSANSENEQVTIASYGPERITLRTDTKAAGLLVLSEIAYPAWKATVDGVPVEVVTAYGLLRAIPLPAGSHVVEFRYDAAAERLGLGISALTILVAGSALFAGVLLRRRPFAFRR
jgi:hypothetical protein